MAKGRILSRRISKSEKVANLSSDTARMFYNWLIPYLDVEGRMEVNPKLIKGEIFPLLDHINVEVINRTLQELDDVGLILLYTIGKKTYLQLTNFKEHQPNLRKDKEPLSNIPPPTADEARPKSAVGPPERPPKLIKAKEKINIKAGGNGSGKADAFSMPSKEEIEHGSTTLILENIEKVSTELYEKKIWPSVHPFKNKMLKNGCNERAVLHTLTRVLIRSPEDPWAYCVAIMQKEDGNFNARDYEKDKR